MIVVQILKVQKFTDKSYSMLHLGSEKKKVYAIYLYKDLVNQ